jgi:hypothetical protein
MIRILAVFLALGTAAFGQDTLLIQPEDQEDVTADSIRALEGTGAEIRMLDKVSGEVTDRTLASGESTSLGRIEMTLGECRYPEDNPTGEAYAWLEVRDPNRDAVLFQGWMIATSPALNALDNARYDVWVIRCTTV